jgi:hypothetical protein
MSKAGSQVSEKTTLYDCPKVQNNLKLSFRALLTQSGTQQLKMVRH